MIHLAAVDLRLLLVVAMHQVGDRFVQMVERIRERSRQMARMFNLPFEMGEGYRYFRLD